MKIRISFLMGLLLAFLSACCFTQAYTQLDEEIYQKKLKLASELGLRDKPINEVVVAVAKSFIGVPYEANTLDGGDKEKLIVHLTGLDCTTFLENVLAISYAIKQQGDFQNYTDILTQIRYRHGIIKDYPSRLHYFSDWIYDGVQKKMIKDISQEIGGDFIGFQVNFMSHHPGLYPALKAYPAFIPIIARQELAINKIKYFYIPKDKIEKISAKMNSGDLLAITTSAEGLDIAHVGIAIREADGKIYMLHASSQHGKVEITEFPLTDYLQGIKKDTGIIVLRSL